jgi:biopolymer transport protein ExbB/TolQ
MGGMTAKSKSIVLGAAAFGVTMADALPALAEEAKAANTGGFSAAAKILLTHGGAFPYLNIFVLAVGLAVIFSRFIKLTQYSMSADQFMTQLIRLVREGRIDSARRLCQSAPKKVLARVMLSGLDRANRGEAEVSAAMEECMMELTPEVGKFIPALFPIANIATLFGLIGTISGLIKSFAALNSASPEQKSAVLSLGISEAMYNTAFGLLIAVSCLAAQLVLATWAKGIVEDIEFNAIRLENLLARRAAGDLEEPAPAAAPAKA